MLRVLRDSLNIFSISHFVQLFRSCSTKLKCNFIHIQAHFEFYEIRVFLSPNINHNYNSGYIFHLLQRQNLCGKWSNIIIARNELLISANKRISHWNISTGTSLHHFQEILCHGFCHDENVTWPNLWDFRQYFVKVWKLQLVNKGKL